MRGPRDRHRQRKDEFAPAAVEKECVTRAAARDSVSVQRVTGLGTYEVGKTLAHARPAAAADPIPAMRAEAPGNVATAMATEHRSKEYSKIFQLSGSSGHSGYSAT